MHSDFNFRVHAQNAFLNHVSIKVFLSPKDPQEVPLKIKWEAMRPNFTRTGDRIAFIKSLEDLDFAEKMRLYLDEIGSIESHLSTLLMGSFDKGLDPVKMAIITPGNCLTVNRHKYRLLTIENEYIPEATRVDMNFFYDRVLIVHSRKPSNEG